MLRSPRITTTHVSIALSIIVLCCSKAPAVTISEPPTLTLTILHDNDLHGHLLPFAYTEVGKSSVEQPSRGGAARRATLIRRLRQSSKNPTLLIDSGDIATRGPLITTYEGVPDVEAMNAIGYDIAAIGNNEFKLKDAVDEDDSAGAQSDLLQIIKLSRFPWICANATQADGSLLEGVQPYVVREFSGVRIGFLGLTTSRSAAYPQTKGWSISDPIAAAKQWIPEARKHCDVLIAVTHIGTLDDEQLAAQTTGLDAIIGGDSHTFLYTPVVVKNPSGVNVPIVQDGEFGVDLGRFDLHFTEDPAGAWHLTNYHDILLPVDASSPEAPDVKAVLAPYVAPFLPVVGHLSQIADTPTGRLQQTTRIVLDALRQQTNSDYALNPAGVGLFEVFRHKAITRYDVFAVMPFHDDVLTTSLTGAQISGLINSQPTTVVSGDLTKLVDTKTYTVAFVDYEARSGYKIPESDLVETNLDVRTAVINWFTKGSPSY